MLELSKLREEYAKYDDEIKELDNERQGILAVLNDYKRCLASIDPKRAMLEREKARPSLKQQIEEINQSIFSNTRKRAKLDALLEAALAKEVVKFHERAILMLEQTASQAKVAVITERLNEAKQGMSQTEGEYTRAKEKEKQYKARAKASHEVYKAAKDTASEGVADLFVEGFEVTESLSELESSLISFQTRQEAINELDPEILTQYNQRVTEVFGFDQIRKVERDLERHNGKASSIKDELQKMHDEWKLELDKMVETISANFGDSFASIGCAGEENYDKSRGIFRNGALRFMSSLEIQSNCNS